MASSLDEALARIIGEPGTNVNVGQTGPLATTPPPSDTVALGGTSPPAVTAPVYTPPVAAAPVAVPAAGVAPATPLTAEQSWAESQQRLADSQQKFAADLAAAGVAPSGLSPRAYGAQIGVTPEAFRNMARPERQALKQEYQAYRANPLA